MSDIVAVSRCEALFRAGYDSLGMGLRGTITDLPRLGERLVEVALLRLTKHLFTISDTGRYAAVPTDLVSELAARRGQADTLADSGNSHRWPIILIPYRYETVPVPEFFI
jgi:hypothetical protein